jgi:beta-N-acetylhexosaminidase
MQRILKPSLVLLSILMGASGYGQYTLADFYKDDAALEAKTDSLFKTLNEPARVAQMIITSAGELGKPEKVVKQLVRDNQVGGVVYLKGSKASHSRLITELNEISSTSGHLPLINSMDAEPSLFNGRVQGTPSVMKTIEIKTPWECDSIVGIINSHLHDMGVHHNFAPVVDISPNNEAIKNRSFGSDRDTVVALSRAFIESSQTGGIVATAKHFPGHGLVKGDTHKQSVYIDGELMEADLYPPLIDAGVITVMVGHITVRDNETYGTDGLPSTCSRTIVTDLLKNEMGFQGIVVTDALNIMKAVTILDKAPLKASKAGCDMILMPINEEETIQDILSEMESDEAYRKQVYESVKKILRLKICLGLI